jgi:hypothetical protein
MQPVASRDLSTRRSRVNCKICGQPIELVRMRDHLRTDHQALSADVDSLYLNARIEARKARRSQRL